MQDLTQLSITEFLDRVSDRSPTPGGGSVTGLAGAAGCALGHMVAVYSLKKDTEPAARETIENSAQQLRHCAQIMRALITQDAAAYEKMTTAGRARRDSKGDPAIEGAYERAVFEAAAVPMEMAAVASNALAAMDAFKHFANAFLLSDLEIAAELAAVTARAARVTLQVNAAQLSDESQRESLLSDIDRILLHCAGRTSAIDAYVERHMQEDD